LTVEDGELAQAVEARVGLGDEAMGVIAAEADAQRLRGVLALEGGRFDIEAVGTTFAAAHAVEDDLVVVEPDGLRRADHRRKTRFG